MTRRSLSVLALMAATLTCGCDRNDGGSGQPDARQPLPQQTETSDVPYTILYHGWTFATTQPKCQLVTDRQTLVRKWDELQLASMSAEDMPPAVDFERYQVLVICESYTRTRTSLSMHGITRTDGAATLHYEFDMSQYEAEDTPRALIVSIPLLDVPVEVVRHELLHGEEIGVETILPASL